jgi:predicted outer membrane repeat protein
MKIRVKLTAMAILLAVSSATMAMLIELLTAEAAQAATCNVPSGTYPTIQSASDDASCDTIDLTAAVYVENVTIARSVTIQGQGAVTTTVNGDANGNVFAIQPNLAVTLTKMTITNGTALTGGGIHNEGSTLALDAVTVVSNTATVMTEFGGGGIYSDNGEVRISNSVISGNSAEAFGGAFHGRGGKLTVTNSSFGGNSATHGGGGIYGGGVVTITNSAFTGNSARHGGGIFGSGRLALVNSTFSGNSASWGGGISVASAVTTIANSTFSGNSTLFGGGIDGCCSVTAANTIIANSPSGRDCNRAINSLGYNLDSDGSCNFTASGDVSGADPNLGPLEGSPAYHPLLFPSRAINAGNPAGCTDHSGNPLPTDQPGQPRVGRCDIGAYEHQEVVHTVFQPVVFQDFCRNYFDDFNNPASGWDVVNNEFVRTEYLSGEYRVLSKRSGFIYLFRSPSCDRQSYVVEANARWVGTPGSSYGLLFGITEGFDQYYLFDINTDFQEFRLLRRHPGGFATIVPPTSMAPPVIKGGNASNHLKVIRNGDSITLAINGTIVGDWSDGNITGLTGAGLVSGPYNSIPSSDARFDNFSMSYLPNAVPTQSGVDSDGAMSQVDVSIGNHIAVPINADWWYPKDQIE